MADDKGTSVEKETTATTESEVADDGSEREMVETTESTTVETGEE